MPCETSRTGTGARARGTDIPWRTGGKAAGTGASRASGRHLFEEALQRLLDTGSARTFEQYCIARLSDPSQPFSSLYGIFEKVRGVLRQTGIDSAQNERVSDAAYPNEHSNPTLGGKSSC